MDKFSTWVRQGYKDFVLPKREGCKFAYKPEQSEPFFNDEYPHGWVFHANDKPTDVYVIDYDVTEPGWEARTSTLFGSSRQGIRFKTLARITDTNVRPGWGVKVLSNGLEVGKIEFLKHGCFSGSAPSGKDGPLSPYQPFGELPKIQDLPVIGDVKKFLTAAIKSEKRYTFVFPAAKKEVDKKTTKVKQEVSLQQLEADLKALEYKALEDRAEWLRVMMAVHHQFAGSQEAKELCKAWSAVSPKHTDAEFDQQWNSLQSDKAGAVTYSYIRHLNPIQDVRLRPEGLLCKIVTRSGDSQWYVKDKHGDWHALAPTKGANIYVYAAIKINHEHFDAKLSEFDLEKLVQRIREDEPAYERYSWELEDQYPYLHVNGKKLNAAAGIYAEDKELTLKNIPFEKSEKSNCPYWDKHISDFCCGDAELVEWLRMFFGCALVGDTREQIALVIYGPSGSNGKSTTIKALRKVFGDYAKQFPAKQLFSKHVVAEDTSTEINDVLMSTEGYRLLTIEEIPSGMYLRESEWKTLVGGADIAGRGVYKATREFTSQATVVAATNHMFYFNGLDGGTLRRLVVCPATAQFKGHLHSHEDFLLQERSEILTWLLEGYSTYYAKRKQGWMLKENLPKIIEEETNRWINENIILKSFISQEVIFEKGAKTSIREIAARAMEYVPKRVKSVKYTTDYEIAKDLILTLKNIWQETEMPYIIESEGVVVNINLKDC
jgi:P4 family phage/plasmid primase-like protien